MLRPCAAVTRPACSSPKQNSAFSTATTWSKSGATRPPQTTRRPRPGRSGSLRRLLHRPRTRWQNPGPHTIRKQAATATASPVAWRSRNNAVNRRSANTGPSASHRRRYRFRLSRGKTARATVRRGRGNRFGQGGAERHGEPPGPRRARAGQRRSTLCQMPGQLQLRRDTRPRDGQAEWPHRGRPKACRAALHIHLDERSNTTILLC